MNLSNLIFFEWIIGGFVFSLMLILFLKKYLKKVFLQIILLLKKIQILKSLQRYAHIILPICFFLLVFITRYWLSTKIFGPWYFGDEAIEDCIMPFQFSQGEKIWGGGTNYLTYSIYLAAYQLLGFSVQTARITNIFFFVIAMAFFFISFNSLFGKKIAWFVVIIMTISSPFITHSIFATAITFSLLPISIILWILSKQLSALSAGILGVVTVFSITLYPGAFLTAICLLFLHGILFFHKWTWKTRIISISSIVLSISFLKIFRFLYTKSHKVTAWGGGFLDIKNSMQSISVILKDLFLKSLSFNTLNSKVPYFEPSLIGFLGIGIILLFVSHVSKSDKKWIMLNLFVFTGSIILSSFAGAYPGVRRIFASLPLLILIAGFGFKYLSQSFKNPFIPYSFLILCFGLTLLQTYTIINKRSKLYFSCDFINKVEKKLIRMPPDQEVSIIICSYPALDQYAAKHYQAILMLDKKLRNRFKIISIIPRKNFNVEHNSELKGKVIFFANENFSDNLLQNYFAHLPFSRETLATVKSPKPNKLVSVYYFDIKEN